jgi:hypothetical protein
MKTKQQVTSTQLKEIEYDTETLDLSITFNNDKVYIYSNVPANVFRGLIEADSVVKYFMANIKNNYRYNLVVK